MRVHDVKELVFDLQHRIQRIHGALEHDGDLSPADLTQFGSTLIEDRHAFFAHSTAAVHDVALGDDGRRAQKSTRTVGEGRLA